jgi:hypothetical protein
MRLALLCLELAGWTMNRLLGPGEQEQQHLCDVENSDAI